MIAQCKDYHPQVDYFPVIAHPMLYSYTSVCQQTFLKKRIIPFKLFIVMFNIVEHLWGKRLHHHLDHIRYK